VELVSIRPGKRHAGIVFPDYPGWQGDAHRAAATPGPFVEPALRWVTELRAVVNLAGDIGEWIDAPRPSGYGETRDERTAAAAARSLERLSPRHVELLQRAEAQTEGPDDRDLSLRALRGLGTPGEAEAHLVWLRAVTVQLVRDLEREITAVAHQLCRRHVLTGAEVEAAMRAAYPPIKRSDP
jgi:hypothetical protein